METPAPSTETPVPNFSHESSGSASVKVRWAGLALFALVFATFLPSIHNDFINYDDPLYVTENPQVQAGVTWEGMRWAFTYTGNANWHPLTWLSHMLDCSLFGMQPWGHHLHSVALHAVNAVLAFWFLHRITGALWRSLIVAALFGVHPLRVESVAWVAERKDVLSTMFWLLTLCAYARYVAEIPRANGRPRLYYALALLAFVLGLMAKQMLVSLPFVLWLLDFWPLNRWRRDSARALILEKAPFLLLAMIASGVVYVVQQSGGAMDFAKAVLPWPARLENSVVAYWRYVGTTLWPTDLAVFYPHPGGWPLSMVLVSLVALLIVSALVWMQRAQRPWLLTGWFWFAGTLVPVIGLIQVGEQSIADRYSYIPSLGLLILLVWSAGDVATRRQVQTPALAAMAGTLVFICALGTVRQLGHWRDSETLFRHALAVTRHNHVAWHNLGLALFEHGRADEALRCFQEVLRIKPGYVEEHNNLGMALDSLNRPEAAIAEYQKALTLLPAFAEAHNNLGFALSKQGQVEKAEAEFREAIRLKPGFARAYYNLGRLLEQQGRLEEAVAVYQRGVRMNPWFTPTRASLGLALSKLGRLDEAIGEFRNALQVSPHDRDLRYNLGNALLRRGQLAEAIVEFEKVVNLQPTDAEAHNNLGVAFFQQRQFDDAIRHFREAVRLQPDHAEAARNLTTALRAKEPSHSPSIRP